MNKSVSGKKSSSKYTREHLKMVKYYVNNCKMSLLKAIKKAGFYDISSFYFTLKRVGWKKIDKISYDTNKGVDFL